MAMAMARLFLLTMALVAAAGSCSAWELNSRVPMSVAAAAKRVQLNSAVAPLIHALRPLLGSGGQLGERAGAPCDSWLLGVEAHNVRDWKTVPAKCEGYVGHYMLGGNYRRNSKVIVDEDIAYAEGFKLAGNDKEVWVFDIDETSLFNLPYYAKHGLYYVTTLYNAMSFNAYVLEGSAPMLPETQRLYKKLLSIDAKQVFLTGRTEDQRAVTVGNLRRQGYFGWMNLLLKASAVAYKLVERQKPLDIGYVIVGNIGDQWSDILSAPEDRRTFKLPNPMYYIG